MVKKRTLADINKRNKEFWDGENRRMLDLATSDPRKFLADFNGYSESAAASVPARKPSAAETKFLSEHQITADLRACGISDEQLQQFCFSGGKSPHPFEAWAITGPDEILCVPYSLAKSYCALRWLIIENPTSSRETQDAWQYIANVMADPLTALGEVVKSNQKKATKGSIKYSAEMKLEWKRMASAPDMAGRSKSSKASLIAHREGLPDAAIRTIRKTID